MSFFNIVLISIYIVEAIVLFIIAVKVDRPSILIFFILYIPLFIGFMLTLGLMTSYNMYELLAILDIVFIIFYIYGFVSYQKRKKYYT